MTLNGWLLATTFILIAASWALRLLRIFLSGCEVDLLQTVLGCLVAASGVATIGSWHAGERVTSAGFAFSLIVSLILWWRNRRDRRKKSAARWLGEKGKAAIARLVAALKPAPAPSPQPSGRW